MKKSKRSGLPDSVSMRHDDHFVELISARVYGPRIRMIPLDRIDPNPQQARSELGNIDELMASIKSKGVLEPILVRPRNKRYEIIAGERRYVAAKRVGLNDIPAIEMDVKDNEAMELALIENLQRKDLDVFEEADGLNALVEIYGYNHAQLAEKIGKARSTITEIINVARIPKKLRELCKQAEITSRSTLIEIAKQEKKADMERLINEIAQRGLRREDTRELSKKLKGKIPSSKPYVFNYSPQQNDSYHLRIEFKKHSISPDEIIQVLEEIIARLKSKA
ncbi:MAG TPA: ParB/RepB/Spo0J family partition protein [Candidatus Desulfaltia sp.]|nr:ParB/RepB/Spo0J family partition protein [Candidatus Desulfaltia sp.]